MQFQFLGTGAAEGFPALFCDCYFCQEARRLGGKNIRTRASIQIDQIHKIDFPPDTFYHKLKYGLDLSKVQHLLVTHAHYDHFAPGELHFLAEPFAHIEERESLHIYGNELVGERLELAGDPERAGFVYYQIKPFREFTAGEIQVLPVRAAHARNQEALNFVLQKDGQTVFIAYDTGWFLEPTWKALGKFQFDLIIFDCTHGSLDNAEGHLGIKPLLRMRDRLGEMGSLKENAKLIATHFSHNGRLFHKDLCETLEPEGVQVAYDGLIIET